MEDAPGLEVGDGPFDAGADSVDLLVELPLPVQKFPVGGFLDGRNHAVPNEAFVPHPLARVQRVQHAGIP